MTIWGRDAIAPSRAVVDLWSGMTHPDLGTWILTGTNFATSEPPPAQRRVVPLMIPAGQEYYWSTSWQADVRESLAALAAGDYEDFDDGDDPDDVIRWLLSAED
jgi:hypothetical protein